MKKLLIASITSALMLASQCAFAAIYQWVDKDGVTHFTDDINNVPDSAVKGLKTIKETPVKTIEQPSQSVSPTNAVTEQERFGDKSIEWWQKAFDTGNKEIKSIEENIAKKKSFIDVFEAGRRAGQIFESLEIENYYKFKKELPDDNLKLKSVKEELDLLRRQARDAGVPRGVRGE